MNRPNRRAWIGPALLSASLLAAGAGVRGRLFAEDGVEGDVEKAIIRLQHEWAAAIVNHDKGVVDRVLADDFLATDSTGHHWPRAAYLAGTEADVASLESLETDELRVRVYANTAVVTGRNLVKAKPNHAAYTGTYRITSTWIRQEDRWRCVAATEIRVIE